MNTSSLPVTFCFTEEMKGFMALGQCSFKEGFTKGQAAQLPLMVHLTIRTEDLDAFLASPTHEAQAIGYIEGPLIGGRCAVLKGVFNLFLATGDANRKTMRYRLFFEDGQGLPWTLSGTKHIQNNLGFDLWADTTTLFTHLFAGFVEAPHEAATPIHACGILRIHVGDFIKQLTTFRAETPGMWTRLRAIGRFGYFFVAQLFQLFRPHIHPPLDPFIRQIAVNSLEGVQDAQVSTHYATTGDGLGISLLRFCRAPCRDVVLLVPGLTASSDMFFMPEHQNLTQTLLDSGFTDVWALDGRISKRHPYNLARHRFNVDDVALFDNPAAIDAIRQAVGQEARIHIISHCLGAMSVAMSLFGKSIQNIRSVVVNGVALTPKVNLPASLKLKVGPFACENLLGLDYLNPAWGRSPGLSVGKLLAKTVSLAHHACEVPECHMTSFMWGFGSSVLFNHDNVLDVTHQRTGDLFGGSGMNYYRHIQKMLAANNTAVKYSPSDLRYTSLPANYFEHAASIETPVLLLTGQNNALFGDSNILCYQRLEQLAPGRHTLRVVPGYGHADMFIGGQVAKDVFPEIVSFLRKNSL